MAKITIGKSFGPEPIAPSNVAGLNVSHQYPGHQLVDRHLTDVYAELTFQLSSGEFKICRRWFHPKNNSQRRETKAAEGMLSEMPSLESQKSSNKERRHQKRKTRALGNRLRGEASRTDSQK
jgi:hypothetical protein